MLITFNCKSNFGKRNFGKKNFVKSVFNQNELDIVQNLYKNKFNKRFIKNGNNDSLDGVDMVYVITMPQRKEYITKQINKLKLICKYFDAVKPSDLSTDEYNKLSSTNIVRSDIYKKYTRLPVLLSFVMCFIDAIENKYKNILVFEDDIKININLPILNLGITEFLESPCDIFYMGYCYMNCKQLVSLHKYKQIVEVEDRNILCCHALCIKTEMLPGLINFCFPMNQNSDELFRNYYILNNIKICVPRKAYFLQNRDNIESLNESLEDELLTCTYLN